MTHTMALGEGSKASGDRAHSSIPDSPYMKTYFSLLMVTDSLAPLVSAYFTQLGVSPSPQQMAGECIPVSPSNHANRMG